jgi:hypothetical protein
MDDTPGTAERIDARCIHRDHFRNTHDESSGDTIHSNSNQYLWFNNSEHFDHRERRGPNRAHVFYDIGGLYKRRSHRAQCADGDRDRNHMVGDSDTSERFDA